MSSFDLSELYKVIKDRKGGDPETSYTAKLFYKGRNKIAQKFGEEAVEVVIDYIDNKKKGVIGESADLIYHLLVLWADMGIKPNDVMDELHNRKGMSGIDEKNSRNKKEKNG